MLRKWVIPALAVVGLLGATATASASTGPVASPEALRPAAEESQATVKVVNNATVGTILTDGESHTLYLYTRDERNKTNCFGNCAVVWPPLLTTGAPIASAGVNAGALGQISRGDGTMQVTYNGWPLYHYVQDTALSDVKGQNVGNVWFVVSPYGGPRMNTASVKVTNGVITDMSGRTLYMYTRDTPGVTNCSGNCALIWPPLLSVGNPKAEEGANGNFVNIIRREEGSSQLTYNGWPLYYYAADEKPGDMRGQGVGGVWYVMNAAGEIVRTMGASTAPAATTTATTTNAPAALPRTGDAVAGLAGVLGTLGAAAGAAGVWLRRRRAA